MKKKSFHSVLARNSLMNLARYIVNFAVVFFLTPAIIRAVGDAQYGLWALTFSLVGYAGLLDMGVQLATIKLVAQYNAQNDIERLSGLCSTVLAFFTSMGLIASLFCWVVLPPNMASFVNDPDALALAPEFLAVIGIDVFFVFLGNVFIGVGLGLQQYHLRGLLDMVLALIRLGLTIAVLRTGMGLLGLAWVKLGLDVVAALTMFLVCIRTVPGIRFSMYLINKKSFKSVVSIGGMLFFSSTVARINQNTVPVIISLYLSTAYTAYFMAASKVCSYLKDVSYSITANFLPVFSELKAKDEVDNARSIYLGATRYILLISLPGYVFLVVCGRALLDAWIGPEYGLHGGEVLSLLALAALLDGLHPLAGRAFVGAGKIKQYSILIGAVNALSLGATIVCVPIWGVKGAAVAQCLSSLVGLAVVTQLIRSFPGVGFVQFLKVLAGVCVPSIIFAAALHFLGVDEAGQTMAGLIVGTLKAYVLVAIACLALLTHKERDVVRNWLGTVSQAWTGRAKAPLATPKESGKGGAQ